jgi:eukaryotic-like serine/threonine-protein kinase
MSFIQFIKSRHFWKHFALSIIITLLLVWIATKFLNIYTMHGSFIVVPDLSGMQIEKANELLSDNDLEYVVMDSVYDIKKEKGTIVFQDPLPGSKVKHHRKIYLTVVQTSATKVSMPNLTDLTLQMAISVLQPYDLKVGKLEFVPDIGRNAVLKQKYKGKIIAPGTMIEKGSSIDLVLGKGLEAEKIPIPFLYGKTHEEAINAINAASLNVGEETYESGADSVNGRVYKQNPSFSRGNSMNFGQSVDIWYKSEKKFDFKSFLKKLTRDTARQ